VTNWESSDESVATVAAVSGSKTEAIVTGKKASNTAIRITATGTLANGRSRSEYFTVYVRDAYTLTLALSNSNINGTVALNQGDTRTLTATVTVGSSGVTAGLVSIWFVFGSLVALICAALGAAVWLQIFWFVIVSVATLVLTRPLVKRYVDSRSVATNADRSIGRTAVVTERIDNLAAAGAVKLDGVVWTARSTDDAVAIETGERVTVRAIEGVKLIVERSVR